MKQGGFIFFLVLFTSLFNTVEAQRIKISEPDKDDSRRIDFEIVGKIGANYLIYKKIRGENFICVYDDEMKLIKKKKHEYMPEERMINVDFFPYQDFVYIIYQYQRRNIVHCISVKMDGMGERISEPQELDTSMISSAVNNKIYTSLISEDKQKILIFKVNSKNKKKFLITTKLFNANLELEKRSIMAMSMDEDNDHLGEFAMDNSGNLVFSKFYRSSNESISKAYMVVKKAMADTFSYYPLNIDKIYLDELRVKVDNNNQRYFLTAFYYKQKRGNIDGIYFLSLNRNTMQSELEKTFEFKEDLRQEAKGEANFKMAFNDYFIRNIVIKKDGGFLIDAESFYTTSRSSSWNRYDYMYGSPLTYPLDYYSPYYNSYSWRRGGTMNQSVRYHADNVIILSFDNKGELGWSNVISKEQFDDESDDRISYMMINTGGKLHFLLNMQEKRNIMLNHFELSPDGQVDHNPTLKNLDKGHEFLAKYGRQVSARTIIVPCIYRNYICFAKADF